MGYLKLTYREQNPTLKVVKGLFFSTEKSCAVHYNYDIHGNVKSLLHDNPTLSTLHSSLNTQRYKRMDYTYDLISGNVKMVSYQNAWPDAWHHAYEYDADNRIKTVYTSTYPDASKPEFSPFSYTGSAFWDEDVVYHYYHHGSLARTELGEHNVQGVDMIYTINNWLKAVNSESLLAERDMGKDGHNAPGNINKYFAKDAFGFSLGYFENDYQAISQPTALNNFLADKTGSNLQTGTANLYNGNIGSMVTTIVPPTITPGGLTYAPAPQGMAYKYDRLNRLKSSQAWQNLNTVNNLWETGTTYVGMYENNFSYDANGNITAQVRKDATGTAINDLTYNRRNAGGKTVQNRLYHVNDAVLNTTFTDDIDDQGLFTNNETVNTANNYGYDEIGNLNRNNQKQIAEMVYTVTRKVKEVHRTVGSSKENLKFDFDANGNRIAKHVYTSDDVWKHSDYYVNDAQGNNMAIYTLTASSGSGLSYQLAERNIYGSSRVGTNKTPVEMIGATLPVDVFSHTLGDRNYFLSNHVNNTLVTVTDKKLPIDLDGDFIIDEYWPHVISSADYYGYGVKMKERSFSTESVRYQFNGKEYDNETETSDFGARNLDGDLGIWETPDAYENIFSGVSPYSYVLNNPIRFIDIEGMWPGDANLMIMIGSWGGGSVLKHGDWTVVYASSFEQAQELMAKKGLKKKIFNNLLIGTHGSGDPLKNESQLVTKFQSVNGVTGQSLLKNSAIKAAKDKQLNSLANILEYMAQSPTVVLGACHVAVSEEFNELFYEFVSENVSGNFEVFTSTSDVNFRGTGNKEFDYFHLTPNFNKNVLPKAGDGGMTQVTEKGSSNSVYQSFSYSILNPRYSSVFDFGNKTTNTHRGKSTQNNNKRRRRSPRAKF